MVKDGDTRLIDASTAHRIDPDWVFGFKELEPGHDRIIADARFVSNPGCYSTGAVALIRPLTAAGLLDSDTPVTINGVSGYTGGGKNLIAQMEDHPGRMRFLRRISSTRRPFIISMYRKSRVMGCSIEHLYFPPVSVVFRRE